MPSALGYPQVQQTDQQVAAPPVAIIPFGRAAKRHAEQGASQVLAAPWPATQQTYYVPPYGFLSALIVTVQATGGSGSAVTANADAPWNVLSNVLMGDVNGTPFWNLGGYSSFLARKWGGYRLGRPDQSTFGFQAVTTAGLFKEKFSLFQEFGLGGRGVLPNFDASAAYKLVLTYNSPATGTGPNNVYSAFTGGAPGLTTILEALMRSEPGAQDQFGNAQEVKPPAAGSISYWTSQSFNVAAGSNTLLLARTGNLIRNQILVFRDAGGSRANADSTGVTPPTTLEYQWDGQQRYILNVDSLRELAYDLNGFDADAGTIPLQNTTELGIPINEDGLEWMQTTGATKLGLRFTSSAAGTLEVITNDIVAVSPDIFSHESQ